MVRKYSRSPGSRKYKDYTEETLQKALEEIANGTSINRAADIYNIPASTISSKLRGQHRKQHGGQTALGIEEEDVIINSALVAADWAAPLDMNDLRYFTKAYLDAQHRQVQMFKNNLPGIDWAYSLLQRHADKLNHRIGKNINTSRSSVGPDEINPFYDNLALTLIDKDGNPVPPSNIVNYDETNVQDNPKNSKVYCRRGAKYIERAMNHSRVSTTLMMAAAADGTLLPPYFIYKALSAVQDGWREGGPKGARYVTTPHGWIDTLTFQNWLTEVVVPYRRRKPGKFVLIGDNMSAHLSVGAIQICKDNNIEFVFLPPNSTHLLQPLDVSFFSPFKAAWRIILMQWKKKKPKIKVVPKDCIPRLVKTALTRMNEINNGNNIKRDIISSFKATGICPLNRDQVLKKFPMQGNQEVADSVLTEYLKQQRFGGENQVRRKRRRLNVVPGKSVSGLSDTENSDPEVPESEQEADDVEIDDTVAGDNEIEEVLQQIENAADKPNTSTIKVGCYVLVKFNSSGRRKKEFNYLCSVQEISGDGVQIMAYTCKNLAKTIFVPCEDDISTVPEDHILAVIPDPVVLKQGERVSFVFRQPVNVIEK